MENGTRGAFICVALVALVGSALGVEIAPSSKSPVSVTIRAAPLWSVIKQIESLDRDSLTVDPILANEILLVKVDGIPYSELLGRLAEASGGTWVSTGTGLRLTVTPLQLAEERERIIKTLNRKLPFAIIRLGDIQSATGLGFYDSDWDDQFADSINSIERTVRSEESRFVRQIVKNFDFALLGSLNLGQSLVFTANPNAFQRRLPQSVITELPEARRRHKLISEQFRTLLQTPSKTGMRPTAGDVDMITDRVNDYRDLRVELSHEVPYEYTIQIYLCNYRVITETIHLSQPFRGNSIKFMPRIPSNHQAIEFTFSQPESLVAETEDNVNFRNASWMSYGGNELSNTEITSLQANQYLASKRFQSLDTKEILGNRTTEGLFAIAKDQGLNIIATVPDELIEYELLSYEKNMSLSDFWRILKMQKQILWSLDSKSLVGKPNFGRELRANRLDRAGFAEAMRHRLTIGGMSLESAIRFAQGFPERWDGLFSLISSLATIGPPRYEEAYSKDQTFDDLRFLGTLSKAQISHLIGGGKIPFRELSQGQKQGFINGLKWFSKSEDDETEDESPFETVTHALPFLEAEGFVYANSTEEFGVLRSDFSTATCLSHGLTAEDFGNQLYWRERNAEAATLMGWPTEFRTGKVTKISLKFSIRGFGATYEIFVDEYKSNVLAEKDLPAEFLALARSKAQKIKEETGVFEPESQTP
jgi:hypothetical protein